MCARLVFLPSQGVRIAEADKTLRDARVILVLLEQSPRRAEIVDRLHVRTIVRAHALVKARELRMVGLILIEVPKRVMGLGHADLISLVRVDIERFLDQPLRRDETLDCHELVSLSQLSAWI